MLHMDRHQGVASLRLARPERGNALAPELVEALLEASAEVTADPTVHTLAIYGEGRNFCTGFDLSDLDKLRDGDLVLRFVRIEMLLADLWYSPLRTAARATGRTWGAGADLFAACDRRCAAQGASFRFPGAVFGLVLGTRRLAACVGTDRARRWVGEGLTVEASQALSEGLANEICTGDADVWLNALSQPPAVDRETFAGLKRAMRSDRRDADLAALIRSAARPGLQRRISEYRNHQTAIRQEKIR